MRTLRIEITDESNGKKRTAFRAFEATAILLLDPQVAGEGLLSLARSMAAELDGAAPKAEKLKADPEPPVPDRPLTREEEIAQITTKRSVKKKTASLP